MVLKDEVIENKRMQKGQKVELIKMTYVEGGFFQKWLNRGRYRGVEFTGRVDSFYLGTYPVTQEQYRKVMGGNPSFFSDKPGSEQRPVDFVSWFDAVVFCNCLSISEGFTPVYMLFGIRDPEKWGAVPNDFITNWNDIEEDEEAFGYRLPTRIEWEYAARGGKKSCSCMYAGSDDPDEVAWYKENENDQTWPVGGKKPNELGLYDICGNVWEWCWDWCFDSYNERLPEIDTQLLEWRFLEDASDEKLIENPRGAKRGYDRILCGGSWLSDSKSLRMSNFGKNSPHLYHYNIGFRVLLPLKEKTQCNRFDTEMMCSSGS